MKTILSAVRGWVVVGVILGSGVAWGQGDSKVELPNGCSFYFPSLSLFGTLTTSKAEGRCINGTAVGDWVYGSKAILKNGAVVKSVNAVNFVEGVSHGVHLSLGLELGLLTIVDPAKPSGVGYNFSFNSNDNSLLSINEINRMIDQAAKFAREKGYPAANVGKLKELAKKWHADRSTFVAAWTSDESMTPPSNAKQTNGQDDPKVFGRGARGG